LAERPRGCLTWFRREAGSGVIEWPFRHPCPAAANHANIVNQTNSDPHRRLSVKTGAAVAWEAGNPLEIEMVDIDGPKKGEVMLRKIGSGIDRLKDFLSEWNYFVYCRAKKTFQPI
jgi:hypothetical protein